jgi:hypothetical protein
MGDMVNWASLIAEAGASDAGNDFKLLDPGNQDMRVVESTPAQAKSGKLMYKLKCEITTGPDEGRKMFTQMVLSPDSPTALSIFFRQMAVLGLSREFFAKNPGEDEVAEKLLGARFTGTIGISTYQGQERNEIKNILPPTADNQPGTGSSARNGGPSAPPAPPMTAAAAPKVDMFAGAPANGGKKPAAVGAANAAPNPPF